MNGGDRLTALCHDDLVVSSRVAQPLAGFFIQLFEMHSFHAVSSCLKRPGFSTHENVCQDGELNTGHFSPGCRLPPLCPPTTEEQARVQVLPSRGRRQGTLS